MSHPYKVRTGLDRLIHAARNSAAGLRAAWRYESAFRQECALAVVMLPAAFWLGTTWVERSLLASTIVLVLMAELLNSGIETVVDRFGPELNELSGRAKDYGSAAVTLALLACGLTWGASILHKLYP